MADAGAAPRTSETRRWIGLAAILITLIALAIPVAWYFSQAPLPFAPAMRTSIVTPTTTDPFSFALSPDGRQLAFVASGGGPSRLWLRSMAATSAQPLAGTEGAASPFWSPDSRSVGFFADGGLKWLDIDGGTPHLLTTAVPRGGTWNSDGVILFAQTTGSPVFRISAAGGEAVAVTKLDQQGSHRWPTFLPDGRHFLYFALGTPEKTGIYLASLEAEEPTRLTASDSAAFYVPSGWLLWVRGGALLAQPLDLDRRALVGDSVTVADTAIDTATLALAPAFSVSSTGLVAYRTAGAATRQLRWFDSAGKLLDMLGEPDESGIAYPRVSPDGRRVGVSRAVQGNTDIWLLDRTRATRFTFDSAFDRLPVWAPDGTRIVFDSNREGARNLYLGLVDSPGGEVRLLESQQDVIPGDWSRDGRFILYTRRDPQMDWDLWILPLEGTRKPCLFLQTSFGERNGQFSLTAAGLRTCPISQDPRMCSCARFSRLEPRPMRIVERRRTRLRSGRSRRRVGSIRSGGPMGKRCSTSGRTVK